ncbi:family with sequence similarity 120B [Nesidiocoris tenuis]|uniref:Family with sequence similarity 120B n=1 Tax=Nesidiocoris tenuis TaxID=355587 RepID=A0ABN7ANC5_9HEMI|nr:family with sequence similarity 120B [Nesidiocoris tenuis]
MGIRGMETYLEKNNPQACYPVNVELLITRARNEGQSNTIVVDGMSCLQYIYADLPWLPSGQMKEYVEYLRDFVKRFTDLGAELVFFFDGPPARVKMTEWKRRRLNAINDLQEMLDQLARGVPSTRVEPQYSRHLPSNIGTMTCVLLKQFGCRVIKGIGECDEEIARFAYQNRCLAILGQDTDFVVYPGARHYWSIKNFDKHRMKTLEYSGARLASSLHLHYGHLPLLASLLGNDLIKREEIETFHRKLASRYCGSSKIWFQMNIQNVARFIKSYPPAMDQIMPHLPGLALEVFNDSSKWQLLKDSLISYDITQPPQDDIECSSGDEKWDAIMKMVRNVHLNGATSQLYGAVVRGIYNCSTCLEDYRLQDLPYNQVILKKMRQKIWGILLFEKPRNDEMAYGVWELAVSGPESLENYVFNPALSPRVHHPGLLALWNLDDRQSAMEDVRWALLSDAIDIHHNTIDTSSIPMRLMIFVLTMIYLMNEGLKVQLFELFALISSAVILDDYTTKMLKSLSSDVFDSRAARLYTLVTRSFGSTHLLNIACGYPISQSDANGYNYQDGKLFHYLYKRALQGSTVEQLCETRAKRVEEFKAIMRILPVDKAVIPA